MKWRALVVANLALAAAALGSVARVPVLPASVLEPAPPADEQALTRALEEAEANCEVAVDLEAAIEGTGRVHLDTRELEAAFLDNSLVATRLAPDERARAVLAVRLVRACAADLERSGARPLEGERLTPEDFRFLLGALHATLARVHPGGRGHLGGPGSYRQALLRQFRGMSFDEALGTFE